MEPVKYRDLRLTLWQRQLLIGVVVALTSQVYLSLWAEGFRVSAAAILYPVLLIALTRDRRCPDTGLVTGLCVLFIRIAFDLLGDMSLARALLIEYPGGVFYLCYDALLCLLISDRRAVPPLRLSLSLWLCDFASNLLNLWLSSRFTMLTNLLPLAGVALVRSLIACAILWAGQGYRQLLLRSEHEQRYRRLFLMTANLKTELYFLKKDAENIEGVMSNAYQLYERLEGRSSPEGLTALALSIARDVHEVKKDNLRIIRGLEEDVAEAYDHQSMSLSDLLSILEVSTRQFLEEHRGDIRLECRLDRDIPIREHYRLLSVLKNLVTNAAEAILADRGQGKVRVELTAQGGRLRLTVADNGSGISEELLPTLFDRYRHTQRLDPPPHGLGLGLPVCRRIAQEHGGVLLLTSQEGTGTTVTVSLPNKRSKLQQMNTFLVDLGGGYNRTLAELSDALPSRAFTHQYMD